MTVDTDDFLAHYGVKGMKWGVRKRSKTNDSSTNQKPKINKKVVAIGATAVVGAAAAAYILKSNDISIPVSSISKAAKTAKNLGSGGKAKKAAAAQASAATKKAAAEKAVADFAQDQWRTTVKELEASMKAASEDLYKNHAKTMNDFGAPAMNKKDFLDVSKSVSPNDAMKNWKNPNYVYKL